MSRASRPRRSRPAWAAEPWGADVLNIWRRLRSAYGIPAELRDQLDREHVIVLAENVAVVRHFSGHVPGVFSSSGVTRLRGAFALTDARVLATLPTGPDPRLLAIDSPWDAADGPGRVTIGPKGLQLDIDLRRVDAAFSGSMTLNYKHAIADELLAGLPAAQLQCAIDPLLVYRAAGVRPRK